MTDKGMAGAFVIVGFVTTAIAATLLWGAWALFISGAIILAFGFLSIIFDIVEERKRKS